MSIQGPSAGGVQSSGPTENNRPEAKNSKEAEGSKGEFDKALEKKDKGAKGEKKEDGLEDLFRKAHSKKKDSREDGAFGGEAGKAMDARMGKAAEVQGVENKAMIDKIDKIADKIMVSNAQDVKAVKVDFNNSVLPGTEVMIRKDATGKLNIEFTTTSADSFNFLNKGEQALMDTLNRKIGGDISVDIKMQGGGADQDTGDGRSREQYAFEDEDDKDKQP
ncbi:hypothetical protein M3P05_17425 [Sansalvadorimonas sp. 2012CJ34-2]|uniref:Flagellar hook-length control protein FliK n=1 Tax=Parendozoicomonas callyspongiae TaxID=2942213 RepID=A0ABT0PLU7_9GAMM|nr:type III secretion HpaP family protein [Sansalvadorimonas sp. 2012CJ34-2]MCL6271702.1 hypothetical protein [Sansalvadorimonas sp. 2012CJ34-2]